jgi:hypothetical protein
MPRLHGFRERIDTTVYDAFSPKELLGQRPEIRLFGNKNIGQSGLTNLQCAGQMAADQAFSVLTWYARTNLTDVCRFQIGAPYRGETVPPPMDLIRAWDAWVNISTATLTVGSRPMQTRPLSELLGPRQFGNCCGNPGGTFPGVEILAEKMWIRYRDGLVAGKPTREPDQRTLRDLTPDQREVWLAAAGVYPFTIPIYIPLRQNFGVRIYTDPSALTALLKIMPENVAPRPLVWVHLEGVCARDVS